MQQNNVTVCYSNSTQLPNGECDCEVGFGGEQCTKPIGGNPLKPREGDCDSGWDGLTCRVCKHNQACNQYPFIEPTCHAALSPIKQNYAQCNVTNSGLVAVDPTPLTAVWSCKPKECHLEFFYAKEESFWCGLTNCETVNDEIVCQNVNCQCIPQRTLCGKGGFLDLTDFLQTHVTGPSSLKRTESGYSFSEPHLRDELLKPMFGDNAFELACNVGECVDSWQIIPKPPPDTKFTVIPLIILVVLSFLIFLFCKFKSTSNGHLVLPTDDIPPPPIGIDFNCHDVSYTVNNKQILSNISCTINKGQLCCIMGPSGAGKSTLLSILSNRKIPDSGFTSPSLSPHYIGFVEQHDDLLDYLTVYETVRYALLLKCADLDTSTIDLRISEILDELNISDISKQYIINISGGQRRRVSIACELVKLPLLLFLDEPTSGLDSFNSLQVISILSKLCTNYNRTIILSIHQPRSDVCQLFNKLILLNKQGQLLYSGMWDKLPQYLTSIKKTVPIGYNIADFILDDLSLNTDSAWPVISTPPSAPTPGIPLSQPSTVSIFTIFGALVSRTFLLTIRNPLLLFSHYISSIIVGVLLGCVYYQVTNDISGIQNRMGLFFFICSIYGFTCTSLLSNIHQQKWLFVKEVVHDRLYGSLTYLINLIFMDLIMLRVIPPIMMSMVLFPMVGLQHYVKFILSLVSFNVTSSCVCVLMGILFMRELGTGTMLTSMLMLLSMLFSGLLLNTRILRLI